MITNKFCFIYLREKDAQGNFLVKGGVSIAWLVDAATGDILIGKPAKCMADDPKKGIAGDVFTKEEGRRRAYDNLVFHGAAIRISRDTLVSLAQSQFEQSFQGVRELTPNATNMIASLAKWQISEAIEQFMSSTWYEQVVRAHFELLPGNRLLMAANNTPLKIVFKD